MADQTTSFPLRETLSDHLEALARERGVKPEDLAGELVTAELKRRLPSPKGGTVHPLKKRSDKGL